MPSRTFTQQIVVLGAAGVLLFGLYQSPEPSRAASQTVTQEEPAQRLLPQGYNPDAVIRDPFAVPVQFRQLPAGQVPSGVKTGDKTGVRAQAAPPVLQGIVSAGSAKSAILSVGGDSRSYRVRERAGAYLLVEITDTSVTLQGPEGTIRVPLGR